MPLLYRGPSGLLLLAGYVVINSFFRVHESVTNKEKKEKEVSSKTLLSSPAFFPSRRAAWWFNWPAQSHPDTFPEWG